MLPEELKQNVTVYGPLFPEPVQIIIAVPMGGSVKLDRERRPVEHSL